MLNHTETRQVLAVLIANNASWKSLADSGDAGNWTAEEQPLYKQTEAAIALCEASLARVAEPYERIAKLVSSIYAHGGFHAETQNERELEQALREAGMFYKTPQEYTAACATPQAAAQPVPKGYVKASDAIDVRTIHAQLHDIWCELNAVDTVLGDQHRLMTKVEKLRDACGSAVNCMVPLEAAAQPILEKLHEYALRHAPDYPGIDKAAPWEQLYALMTTLEGIKAANDDLHKLAAAQPSQAGELSDTARLDWLESSEEAHGFCHIAYGDYRHSQIHRPKHPGELPLDRGW